MTTFEQLPRSPHDKLLFTPGPLTTSMTVKQAMLRDLGSRDHEFQRIIVEVREGLLEVVGVSQAEGYEAIPMQGCGTMGLKAVLTSALPPRARLLVLVNGAYGERIFRMAQLLSGVEPLAYRVPEDQTYDPEEVERRLAADSAIAMVVVVHCELKLEGGVPARAARYARNQRVLVEGMRALGFETFVPDALQSPIITTFRNPIIPGFDFRHFYDRLEERGFVIYGGKVLHHATFRIATIGRLFEADIRALLSAIGQTFNIK